mmetsp:Transcript_13291/g.21311  ORF Transcript_13291/g.21311 Transcript_13291/m.21311 type:complete len:111 (+) Transcript_13291:241-573(+)
MHPHSRFRTVAYATSRELLDDTCALRLLEEFFDNHHFILAFAHLGLSKTTKEAKSDAAHDDSNELVAVAIFEENEAVGIAYATDVRHFILHCCPSLHFFQIGNEGTYFPV